MMYSLGLYGTKGSCETIYICAPKVMLSVQDIIAIHISFSKLRSD